MRALLLALAAAASLPACRAASPTLAVAVDKSSGVYTVSVDGKAWYSSPGAPTLCVGGKQTPLALSGTAAASGSDKFGAWTGTTATFSGGGASMEATFKAYASKPNVVVGTASFPKDVDTSGCGGNSALSTHFPEFSTTAGQAADLHTLSWRGGIIGTTAAAKGLAKLGASGLDCGPVVSTDPATTNTLVVSTLNHHKIFPQKTANASWSMGLAAAIPKIPAGWNHSVLFTVATGGATAGVYAWGEVIQGYHETTRLPSVTLTDVGYYTDDGAYYYVWGGGGKYPPHDPELSPWIPLREWPAEVGLIKVKEALYKMGVPVAYMQLDDWWYQGKFFFGNVKAVTDWHASNSSGLFPNGLPAFADKLDLPLQLYTPFWWDNFWTSPEWSKYKTFESTQFKGTKLVQPVDAYKFFAEFFDLGKTMTNGRFSTYEIDFLDANFAGCADCFLDVDAADLWYVGMAKAAGERNVTIQYCLPSATDMLESLSLPAVVQARASGDYARPEGNKQPWGNVVTLGGASLLMGATKMAPSKDTLWTASPQPNTSSDRTNSGYHTQPHVELDSILAVLSLGPVGISDALGLTDAGLISQGFASATDSTLLRPSRPLSTVDAVFTNKSMSSTAPDDASLYSCDEEHGSCAEADAGSPDIRATHAALDGGGANSHYVLAWMTTTDATLQATDLYPAPAKTAKLAVRKHVVKPAGAAQSAGCEDGKPASGCVDILAAGTMPTIPSVGGQISDYSLTVVYEPQSNGAYFLGELDKFVHVSPQRFESVEVKGSGPCGLTATLKGAAGAKVSHTCIDSKGTVHATTTTIASGGSVDVAV